MASRTDRKNETSVAYFHIPTVPMNYYLISCSVAKNKKYKIFIIN